MFIICIIELSALEQLQSAMTFFIKGGLLQEMTMGCNYTSILNPGSTSYADLPPSTPQFSFVLSLTTVST